MTSITARRTVAAFTLIFTLAAFPAIYARAQTDSPSGDWTGQMTVGCDEMMNGGSADGGMMSGRQADRGMMGGERPNQQWRR